MKYYGIDEFDSDINLLKKWVEKQKRTYTGIYGIPRGGIYVAMALSYKTVLPLVVSPPGEDTSILVVDDLVDSGATRDKFPKHDFVVIHLGIDPKVMPSFFLRKKDDWIQYWWEKGETPADDAIIRLIEYIGEKPNREGLRETPDRVIKAYDFLFSGYAQEPSSVMKVFENEGYDQIVLLKDIEIYSMCEHHMLPFFGKAHIAYIPDKKLIGVSKLARLIEMYARRLQIQERIGEQVTTALIENLSPIGAACIIEAQHLCMRMRGVEKQNSILSTSSLKGVFLEDSPKGIAAREELMRLIK